MDKKKAKPTKTSGKKAAAKQEAPQKAPLNKNIKLAIGALVALLIIAFPKPQRITYEYANMVSEGTYWDGVYGNGQLLDSNAVLVILDEDTNHLHVCFSEDDSNCMRYKIIENSGFFGYIGGLF